MPLLSPEPTVWKHWGKITHAVQEEEQEEEEEEQEEEEEGLFAITTAM